MLLALGARRTGADARMLVNAAATLRWMTATSAAFARGDLSWGQVRAVVAGVLSGGAAGRACTHELIRGQAENLNRMDPDEILARVDDAVSGLRADLALAR